MLPEKYRLKKSRDIKSVLKFGRTSREGFLILKTRENNSAGPRFAFLISKKVSQKAVIRNRLRRKLREAVKLNLPNIPKNIDAVLIVISDFSSKSSQEAGELINKLFSRAKICH